MSDRRLNQVCGALVLLIALTSGVNLYLTVQMTRSTRERTAGFAASRAAYEARLTRIEGKLDALDADLDTHQQMMDDLSTLQSQVRALRAGSK